MVLNCNSGKMNFGHFLITPHMYYLEFSNVISSEQVLSCEMGSFINVLVKPQKYENDFFLLRLFFDINNKKLKMCHLTMLDNDNVPTWDNWSYENEMIRKEKNERWLMQETQRVNYSYKWGKVRSIYNELEGSSYVVIEYF